MTEHTEHQEKRGVGRPSNPKRKQRINVTFSPDTLAELEARIPEKQRSAFLEKLVRREFGMSPLRVFGNNGGLPPDLVKIKTALPMWMA